MPTLMELHVLMDLSQSQSKTCCFLEYWILRTLITCLIDYCKEQSNSVNPDLCMNISYGRGLWRSVYGHFGLGKFELWMSNCLQFTIFLSTLNGLLNPPGHFQRVTIPCVADVEADVISISHQQHGKSIHDAHRRDWYNGDTGFRDQK